MRRDASTWAAGYPRSIAANRAERLAPEQRAALGQGAAWQLSAALAAALGVVAVTLAAPGVRPLQGLRFLLAVLAIVLIAFGAPRLVDAVRGRVAHVDGPLGVRALYRGGTRLLAGERSFRVDDDVLQRVRTGSVYRVYYAPLSRRVVNYELLE